MFSVALLLFGYAMENALKGLIVQRRAASSVRNERGELDREITTHNLVKLAHAAGVQLRSEESDLLLRLKSFVDWAGRYPVMRDLGGLRDGQLVPNASFHPVNDQPLIEGVFQNITRQYEPRFVRLSDFRRRRSAPKIERK